MQQTQALVALRYKSKGPTTKYTKLHWPHRIKRERREKVASPLSHWDRKFGHLFCQLRIITVHMRDIFLLFCSLCYSEAPICLSLLAYCIYLKLHWSIINFNFIISKIIFFTLKNFLLLKIINYFFDISHNIKKYYKK